VVFVYCVVFGNCASREGQKQGVGRRMAVLDDGVEDRDELSPDVRLHPISQPDDDDIMDDDKKEGKLNNFTFSHTFTRV
jgi:hypothetical protein